MGLKEAFFDRCIKILDPVRAVVNLDYRFRRGTMLEAAKIHFQRWSGNSSWIEATILAHQQLFLLQAMHPEGPLGRDYFEYLELRRNLAREGTKPEITFNEFRSLRPRQEINFPLNID